MVASYNNQYLTLSGKDPILVRHCKASRDNLLIETMNENNWHEFLYESIRGSFSDDELNNDWISNIFKNLIICFKSYETVFKDIAYFYQKLLLSRAQNNIIKVYKFIAVQFTNIHGLEKAIHYEELF